MGVGKIRAEGRVRWQYEKNDEKNSYIRNRAFVDFDFLLHFLDIADDLGDLHVA